MAKELYRQGDVVWIKTDRTPEGLTEIAPAKDGSTVFALGEVTGHRHRLRPEESAPLFEIPRSERVEGARNVAAQAGDMSLALDRLLALSKPATVVHEEHDPITLPEGNYEVRIQRTYTPSRIMNVAD